MKRLMLVMTVVGLFGTSAFAGDPGGTPGLAKAIFRGSAFDTTSDVASHAIGYEFAPEEMYASSLAEKTTVAWEGYMRMVAGTTYNFKGRYDDYVTVKIAGNWVVSKGNGCQERSGSYTPTATDWYKIEFRVANDGGDGGCMVSAYYGILWKTASEEAWHQVSDDGNGALFKTGLTGLKCLQNIPIIVSSQIRANDPTILDVVYKVTSDKPTVNVRALAFEDGERSFFKVVRPETFVKDADGNATAQNIGDGIAANVEHKLSWKVSKDWDADLAKLKFEILVSDVAQLPMKHAKIAERGRSPSLTVAYGTQTDEDIFNAMLWCYADGAVDLVNNDGYVDTTNGIRLVNRTALANRLEPLRYVYDKMGYEALVGGNLLSYARRATRRDLQFNSKIQNSAVLKSSKPTELYVGEKAYCVIDLSGGVYADSYPVSYLDSEPCDGWNEEYKTTKLLLRRIEPGVFMMQGNREVTLTKPFYIGVYPVTQKQYELVTGKNPSFEKGDLIPVQVSWNEARGDSAVYNWPTVRTVDQNSFFGRVQAKSGLKVDLPTEAEWEYACRAGTTTGYNNGGDEDIDLMLVGNIGFDGTGGDLPVAIGRFQPNRWGLFDMHGNVGEWCLDHYDGDLNSDPQADPEGSLDGSHRVCRGYRIGAWAGRDAKSSYRYDRDPSHSRDNFSGGWALTYNGFRVMIDLSR